MITSERLRLIRAALDSDTKLRSVQNLLDAAPEAQNGPYSDEQAQPHTRLPGEYQRPPVGTQPSIPTRPGAPLTRADLRPGQIVEARTPYRVRTTRYGTDVGHRTHREGAHKLDQIGETYWVNIPWHIERTRWRVFRGLRGWVARSGRQIRWFPTHAEAIAYADQQARQEIPR